MSEPSGRQGKDPRAPFCRRRFGPASGRRAPDIRLPSACGIPFLHQRSTATFLSCFDTGQIDLARAARRSLRPFRQSASRSLFELHEGPHRGLCPIVAAHFSASSSTSTQYHFVPLYQCKAIRRSYRHCSLDVRCACCPRTPIICRSHDQNAHASGMTRRYSARPLPCP